MTDYESVKNILETLGVEFYEFNDKKEKSLILFTIPIKDFKTKKFKYHKGNVSKGDNEDFATSFNFNSQGKFLYSHLGARD
jgi:hypothetical protein